VSTTTEELAEDVMIESDSKIDTQTIVDRSSEIVIPTDFSDSMNDYEKFLQRAILTNLIARD